MQKNIVSCTVSEVYQAYTRTALWMQICENLKPEWLPIPKELVEDRWATFGAYNEFEYPRPSLRE